MEKNRLIIFCRFKALKPDILNQQVSKNDKIAIEILQWLVWRMHLKYIIEYINTTQNGTIMTGLLNQANTFKTNSGEQQQRYAEGSAAGTLKERRKLDLCFLAGSEC